MKSAGGCKPFLILYLLFIAKIGIHCSIQMHFIFPERCCLLWNDLLNCSSCKQSCKRNLQPYDLSTWVVIHNICRLASIVLFSQKGKSFFFFSLYELLNYTRLHIYGSLLQSLKHWAEKTQSVRKENHGFESSFINISCKTLSGSFHLNCTFLKCLM